MLDTTNSQADRAVDAVNAEYRIIELLQPEIFVGQQIESYTDDIHVDVLALNTLELLQHGDLVDGSGESICGYPAAPEAEKSTQNRHAATGININAPHN